MTERYGDGYDVGDVVRNSWGYDQSNYDFYRIVRRTAQTVMLHELEQRSTGEAGFMAEYVEPTDRLRSDRVPFRRKLRRDRETGEIRGLQVNSYGWATSWDGRRSRATHYA